MEGLPMQHLMYCCPFFLLKLGKMVHLPVDISPEIGYFFYRLNLSPFIIKWQVESRRVCFYIEMGVERVPDEQHLWWRGEVYQHRRLFQGIVIPEHI